eukprot:TRINITY_DN5128_c0_g1_i2.p1 TRINITY_DN5128_c0_g1~~TRINITY_DN5128_c0_g1_i2.p1  ORF type:complete len:250 (+),score=83.56 TRINITY_DN5128_c0_g1_i2:806-1555(+)
MASLEAFESPAQRAARLQSVSRGSIQSFVTRLANHADNTAEQEEEVTERGRFIENFYLDEFLHPMEDRFVPINRTQGGVENPKSNIQSLKSLNARTLTVEDESDSEYDSDGGSPKGSPRKSDSDSAPVSPGSPSMHSKLASKSKWKAIRERAKKGTLKVKEKRSAGRPRGRTRSDSLYGDQGVIYDLDVVSGGSDKKRAFMSQLEKWEQELDGLDVNDAEFEGDATFDTDFVGDGDAREVHLSSGPGWK